MFKEKIFKSKVLAIGVIVAFSLLVLPVQAQTQKKPGPGSLTGFIYDEDMKTPVENALVKIRNSQDGKEYQSLPTDKNGLYAIKDVAQGRYVLGVSTEKGDYNCEYDLYVMADDMAKLSLALKTETPSPQQEQEKEKKKKKRVGFFLTTAGMLVIAFTTASLAYGTYKLIKEGEAKSPIKR